MIDAKPFKFVVALAALLASLGWPGGAGAADPVVGSVRKVSGEAFVVRGGQKTAATIQTRLLQNDTLATGSDGSMGIILRDDTVLSLGPNSKLTLDRFLFEPAQKRFGLATTLVRGSAAYLSGQIGKLAPETVQMKTPVATIGIRGTRFLVNVKAPE